MSKKLLIVESPAKAKTIAKYLGDAFTVKSSVGHICDIHKFQFTHSHELRRGCIYNKKHSCNKPLCGKVFVNLLCSCHSIYQ